MKEIMATIRIAPGRVGFYDPLSRIHLSLARPEAYVYSGTNCAQLRRAVKDGILRLMDGTLGSDVPPFKITKVGDRYVLKPNTAEEMKPVFKKEQPAAKAPEKPETVEAPKAEEAPEIIETVETAEAPVEEAPAEEAPKEEAAEEKTKTKKKAVQKKKAAK